MNRKWFAELHFWCLIIVLIILRSFFVGTIFKGGRSKHAQWTKIKNFIWKLLQKIKTCSDTYCSLTLESGIVVGQGIYVGPGKLVLKNKHRALNKRRAWTKCAKLCYEKTIKLENICRPWKKFQNFINIGPLIRL